MHRTCWCRGLLSRLTTFPAERYDPKVNPVVRVRVRFPNGCPRGMFQIYVAVNGSTSTGTNAQLRMVSKTLTGWQTVDFDLMAINEIVSGATDISRIILGDTRTASNGVFEVDFVGVGRYGAPVSRAVFLEEKSARVSADQANVESVETLQTRVKDVEGSVQTVQKSVQSLDGKVSTTWSVNVQQDINNRKYLAGIGVGIESQGQGSPVQSAIAMVADSWAQQLSPPRI
ncbi:hypothetical protein G6F57_017527 [Rhizopus arrhizus]|nr:hypothetical protein G6F57_017527 [Rhizopus arrhizus]